MKTIHKKLDFKAKYNYMKIETSGLSRDKDQIISIGILEKNSDNIINYTIESLKEEKDLIDSIISVAQHKEFITLSGNTFDLPFLNEKSRFYSGKNIDVNLIDTQKIIKKYNYLFNLESYSIKNLLLYFNICKKEDLVDGIKNHIYFKNFIEGKSDNFDKISENNIINITYLIKLYDAIKSEIENKLSFSILNYNFCIKDINLNMNTLEVIGKSNYEYKYFNTNKFYTLDLSNEFNLKINTMDLPYDEDNKCYLVMKKDYGNIINRSKIKSPNKILILYYKNYIYENILEITKFILNKEINNM